MEDLVIDIQLDPVTDGINWNLGKKKAGALIIGTNGEYRVAEEEEVNHICQQLLDSGEADYLGKTKFLVVYNGEKVFMAEGRRYIAGSVMIVKETEEGIALLDSETDFQDVLVEFESRLVTLCGNGCEFSAYEV